ncbi:MAG TPA: alpha/beta fold hydrolase, partial [Agitococcus sp.]|nr:alpha/beta fold hydrolase [Agitococcus sp.]
MSSAITCPHQDIYINHPQGQIFSRIWTPLNYQASLAPIILLHDSLGCVALWRDFPMQLAICSGRQVIAYDRLGFGQSSARLKKIAFSFIEDEAKNDFALVKQQLNIKEFVVLGHSVGGS